MSSKQRALICWVGGNDLKAVSGGEIGPIMSMLTAEKFDRVDLLCSYPPDRVEPYLAWLRKRVDLPVQAYHETLRSPVHFGDIYQSASKHLQRLFAARMDLSILLSPGTPAMQAVWILLGKTSYPATFSNPRLSKVCSR